MENEAQSQKKSKACHILELVSLCLLFAFITIVAYVLYRVVVPRKVSYNLQACPLDAMQCPDGSYVSRKGPTCEFEICPISKLSIYTDPAFTFSYPSTYVLKDNSLVAPLPPECQPPHQCGGNPSMVVVDKYVSTVQASLLKFIYARVDEDSNGSKEFDQLLKKNYIKLDLTSSGASDGNINRSVPSGGSRTEVYLKKNNIIVMISFESIEENIMETLLTTFKFR